MRVQSREGTTIFYEWLHVRTIKSFILESTVGDIFTWQSVPSCLILLNETRLSKSNDPTFFINRKVRSESGTAIQLFERLADSSVEKGQGEWENLNK